MRDTRASLPCTTLRWAPSLGSSLYPCVTSTGWPYFPDILSGAPCCICSTGPHLLPKRSPRPEVGPISQHAFITGHHGRPLQPTALPGLQAGANRCECQPRPSIDHGCHNRKPDSHFGSTQQAIRWSNFLSKAPSISHGSWSKTECWDQLLQRPPATGAQPKLGVRRQRGIAWPSPGSGRWHSGGATGGAAWQGATPALSRPQPGGLARCAGATLAGQAGQDKPPVAEGSKSLPLLGGVPSGEQLPGKNQDHNTALMSSTPPSHILLRSRLVGDGRQSSPKTK